MGHSIHVDTIHTRNLYARLGALYTAGRTKFTARALALWFAAILQSSLVSIGVSSIRVASNSTGSYGVDVGYADSLPARTTAYRPPVILWLLSPAVLISVTIGQLEWLVLAALLVPPQWGILLTLIKPQVGIGLVVYWGVTSLREKGLWDTIKLFVPATLLFTLSVLIYGLWFTHWSDLPVWTFWPYNIPIGLFMMGVAFKQKRPEWALAASPFFGSYTRIYSFVGLILLPRTKLAFWCLVISMWIVTLLLLAL